MTADGWTGKKKDVTPILRRFAEQRDFREKRLSIRGFGAFASGGGNSGGKAFCKETASGLIFHCWVDTGWLRISGRLPINWYVSHIEDPFPPLGAGPNAIYEGAEYYARFTAPSLAVFGVFALMEIFDAFYSTFS